MKARMTNDRMKMILKISVLSAMLSLMVLIGAVTASAEIHSGTCGEQGQNVTWTLDTETGVLSISGYGSMKGYSQYVNPSWYPYREHIKEASISSGITTVGYWAFYGCENLEKVSIPESVTRIRFSAFSGCKSLREVNIPSRVKVIESSTFYGCEALESILLPSGVTSIQSSAFAGCRSLRSIVIPDQVTTLEIHAFSSCNALESVTLSNRLVTMGDYVFSGCWNLTGMVFPDSLVSIGKQAFGYCSAWETLIIPNTLTDIGESNFLGFSSLKQITVEAGNPVYHSTGNCLIETATKKLLVGCQTSVIPADGSVTSIGNNAFSECASLTGITIPASITSIGNNAFFNCSSLSSITVDAGNPVYRSAGNCLIERTTGKLVLGCRTSVIPADGTVREIGDGAFRYCTELKKITIPAGVTRIGNAAFMGCSGLSKITFPAGLKTIGDGAFYDCDGLHSVDFPDGLEAVGSSAFENCDKLNSVTMTDSVKSIGPLAFLDCVKLKHVELSDSIEVLEEGILANTDIKSIDLPSNLKETRCDVFYGCDDLRSLHIPAGVTNIWDCLIWACTGLESLTVDSQNPIYHSAGNCIIETASKTLIAGCNRSSIPSDGSVTSISWNAFIGMSFSEITIPHAVTYIERGAFDYCENLTDLYYMGTEASWRNVNVQDTSLRGVTVHYLAGYEIRNGTLVNGTYVETESNALAQGLVLCEDGRIRYCLNGIPQYAGAVVDSHGYVYYINSSDKAAVQGKVYYVTLNNGILPSGYYTADEDGRLMDGRGNYVKADTAMEDGLKFFADGSRAYYKNGAKHQAGLIEFEGDYYYIAEQGKPVTDTIRYVFLTNGLKFPNGNPITQGYYRFDENGKMVLVKNGLMDGLYYENYQSVRGLVYWNGHYYYFSVKSPMAITRTTHFITNTNSLTLPDGTIIPTGTYRFDDEGKMDVTIKNGLIDGVYYKDNLPVWGLICIDGDYYHLWGENQFTKDKVLKVTLTNGLTFPDGTPINQGYYRFDKDGKMIFVENGLSDGTYYEDYQVKSGLVCVNGDYYYISTRDHMAVTGQVYHINNTNGLTLPDGTPIPTGTYEFDADGKMKAVIKNGLIDGVYYENNLPKNYAGLIEQDGSYYYINDNAKPVAGKSYYITNTHGLLPKGWYDFDENGKLILP